MIRELKDLVADSFYLYLIQGLNYLLPLIVLPYLIVTLGANSFGIFAYSQSFIQFLTLVVDFGFNLSVTKRIARFPENSPKVVEIYWLTTVIKSVLLAISSIGIWVFLAMNKSLTQYESAIMLSMLSLVGNVLFPIWLFQGLNQMKLMSIINAISKLITYPLIFVFVRAPADYLNAVVISSSSLLVAGVISVAWIMYKNPSYRNIPVARINLVKATKLVKEAWPIFLSNSAISMYTSSLVVMLGFYATASQVGVFGAIERIVRVICFGVYVPINQASFPKIARLKYTDYLKANQLFKIVFYLVATIMICTSLGYFLVENIILDKFFREYHNVEPILRIAIFTIIPIALGGVCGQLGLLALGGEEQKKAFSKTYYYVGTLSIVCSILAIKFYQIEGAVFSMMITELAIFLIMFVLVKKYRYL